MEMVGDSYVFYQWPINRDDRVLASTIDFVEEHGLLTVHLVEGLEERGFAIRWHEAELFSYQHAFFYSDVWTLKELVRSGEGESWISKRNLGLDDIYHREWWPVAGGFRMYGKQLWVDSYNVVLVNEQEGGCSITFKDTNLNHKAGILFSASDPTPEIFSELEDVVGKTGLDPFMVISIVGRAVRRGFLKRWPTVEEEIMGFNPIDPDLVKIELDW